MRLDEVLQVVYGKYKVMCKGKELDTTEKIDEKRLIVEFIVTTDDVIHIQVEGRSSVPSNLNEKQVKEHVKKYGVLPNIFDGC